MSIRIKFFDLSFFTSLVQMETAINTWLEKWGAYVIQGEVGKSFATFLYEDQRDVTVNTSQVRRIRSGSGEERQPVSRVSSSEPSS